MRDLEGPETIRVAAGKIAAEAGRFLSKVNPDVWRELAYVSMSAYSLFLPRREAIVDRGEDGFAPVVFVHGLGGNRGAWWPLRLFLMMKGHRSLYAFDHGEGAIEVHANRLNAFVDEVLATTKASHVDIVAHSLGGIISRCAIHRLGLHRRVRTLVTMATSHQGTYAAHYANTPLTRPLRPDSALLRELNRAPADRYPVRFVSIWSDRDVYVVPAESMKHPRAENIFIPGISHSQYLVSPRVFQLVASVLESEDVRDGRAGTYEKALPVLPNG
jgi:pimeloyl-ACP methyl ester carboxylesterase